MTTINMPKLPDAEAAPATNQGRPKLERYLLQVDRQTKQTFAAFADAEKAGKAIKAAHPIVQVSVYDSKDSVQTMLEG